MPLVRLRLVHIPTTGRHGESGSGSRDAAWRPRILVSHAKAVPPTTTQATPPSAMAASTPRADATPPMSSPPIGRGAHEDRRVDAHDPAAQLVRDAELDGRVGGGRHGDRPEADERACATSASGKDCTTAAADLGDAQHDGAGHDEARSGASRERDGQGRHQRADAGRGHQEAVARRRPTSRTSGRGSG